MNRHVRQEKNSSMGKLLLLVTLKQVENLLEVIELRRVSDSTTSVGQELLNLICALLGLLQHASKLL